MGNPHMLRILKTAVPLALLLALPLLLRGQTAKEQEAASETVTILSPHSAPIKEETTGAFLNYYRAKTGRTVRIDWLNVGGTADIVRYIDERFTTAFRRQWEAAGKSWTPAVAAAFKSGRQAPNAAEASARAEFLASNCSIGVDIFFGGGSFDMNRNAERGYAVSANLEPTVPEYFAQVPVNFSGEMLRHPGGLFYGTCLSSFGICANFARLRELGVPVPQCWEDMASPRLFMEIAAADPTKSGSINKCYEMIIQQAMQENLDPAAGWAAGLLRLQRILANARIITDSAGHAVREVSSGNAAAGMAIDFYAAAEAEWSAWQNGGTPRVGYIPPKNGSAVTCDPVQLLRGAPNAPAAREFIAFLLSPAGQKLWGFRPGAPGGPAKHALRRSPILPSMYGEPHRQHMIDRDYNPYTAAAGFEYKAEYTGSYFALLRIMIKCAMLDVHPEMQAAWKALNAAGGPEKVPQAWAEFSRAPITFAEAPDMKKRLSAGGAAALAVRRGLATSARARFLRARELAEARK